MDNNHIVEKNREVFASFPDSPYLGHIPDYGQKGGKTVRKALRMITVAAAVLSVPLALYTAYDIFSAEDPVTEQVATAVVQRTYMVNDGVKGSVMLPDSTIVCLNSGSVLEISDSFESCRSVTLKGEGYFEVKADKSNPFYINTPKGVKIMVTGTEFNLCCYEDQNDVKLSLVRGSVEVISGENTIYRVSENEDIRITDGKIMKSAAKVEDAAAWTKGKLLFDDTPMKDVIIRLERWYGVDISVEDIRIYNSSFTGEFSGESLVQVLELLSITSDIEYNIKGNTVILNQ